MRAFPTSLIPLDLLDVLSPVTFGKQYKSQSVTQLPAACSYFLLPRHSLNRSNKSAEVQDAVQNIAIFYTIHDHALSSFDMPAKPTNAYKWLTAPYVMLCYVVLCYVILCCVILCYVLLYYIILYYIILYYIILCTQCACYMFRPQFWPFSG